MITPCATTNISPKKIFFPLLYTHTTTIIMTSLYFHQYALPQFFLPQIYQLFRTPDSQQNVCSFFSLVHIFYQCIIFFILYSIVLRSVCLINPQILIFHLPHYRILFLQKTIINSYTNKLRKIPQPIEYVFFISLSYAHYRSLTYVSYAHLHFNFTHYYFSCLLFKIYSEILLTTKYSIINGHS